jgi:hypothetical protein
MKTTQVSLIGISLVSGIVLGIAATLLLISPAMANKPDSAYAAPDTIFAPQPVPAAGEYFPAQFEEAQRSARQHELPAQF